MSLPPLLDDLHAALDREAAASRDRPARIRMSQDLRDRLTADLAAGPAHQAGPHVLQRDPGIPIEIDEDLKPGEWHLVDRDGRILAGTVQHDGRTFAYRVPSELLEHRVDTLLAERVGMTTAAYTASRYRPYTASGYRPPPQPWRVFGCA